MSDAFAQRYLRHPDLFPRRLSGESCGELGLSIDFVGGPFVVSGLATWQEEVVRRLWGESCREPTASEAPSIRIFRAAPSDFLAGDRAGQPMGLDFRHQQERVDFAGRHLLGVVQCSEGLVERAALWSAAEDEQEFAGVFENFFRVVVAYRLLDLGGVLLHSAAVVDRERVFVFVGHSGAGKSTLSRLSLEGGRRVLSDDLNAVVPIDATSASPAQDRRPSGFIVERLPFAGDLREMCSDSTRQRVELGGVALLGKGERHEVKPVSAAKALAALLSAAPFVNSDPSRAERLEQILLRLCQPAAPRAQDARTPSLFELRFHPRDDHFWEVVRAFSEA